MWSWLAQIDPSIVASVAVAGLTWVWNQARGKKKASQTDVLSNVMENFVQELADRYTPASGDVTEYLKRARKYIDERMWPVLAKRGIPKNKTTQTLANAALERATAWLGAEVRKLRGNK